MEHVTMIIIRPWSRQKCNTYFFILRCVFYLHYYVGVIELAKNTVIHTLCTFFFFFFSNYLYCCHSKCLMYVSHGCCNKLTQNGWFKTQIYSLVVLEVRSPKWVLLSWNQVISMAACSLEALGDNLFLGCSSFWWLPVFTLSYKHNITFDKYFFC